jgi:UDP-glucose 4-epimerase
MAGMRVFITGVAGFLGSHLADTFLERGDSVSGCDNLIGGDLVNVPAGVDFYEGDCNEYERLKKALRAVDVVYHCAATAHEGLSVFSPYENARNGYGASAAVFSAACAARVKRIVHCSSMARYGQGQRPPPFTEDMEPMPEDPYGIGKYASEMLLQNLCETHGIEWSVAIPHNIHGERQCMIDPFRNVVSIFANLMLQKRQPIIYGDGSQERCFSYVSDDIGPLAQMADSPEAQGQCFNIGPDSEVISILDLAKLIAKALGFRLDPIFKPGRPREVKFAHCSADKARKLLGYEPKVGLEDGIARTVAWVAKQGPKPFSYHRLDLEIEQSKAPLPETWSRRLF